MPVAFLIDGMVIVQRIAMDRKTLAEIVSAVLAAGMAEVGLTLYLMYTMRTQSRTLKEKYEGKVLVFTI